MQELPKDGSYFLGDCDGDKCRRSGVLVRRLRLDKAEEGAQVYLCESDWNLEMKSRRWHNISGVAEPWQIYGFYDPEPSTEEAKEVEMVDIVYPVINFTRIGKDRLRTHIDVWITFRNMNGVVVTTPYQAHVEHNMIGDAISNSREHMQLTKRIYGVISLMPSLKHFDRGTQLSLHDMFRQVNLLVFDALDIAEAKEIMKYA